MTIPCCPVCHRPMTQARGTVTDLWYCARQRREWEQLQRLAHAQSPSAYLSAPHDNTPAFYRVAVGAA